HFAQRHIGEDDVSGHAAFVGEFTAKTTQVRKQYFVAFDRAWLDSRAFLRDFDLLGQNDRRPLSQCLHTGGRKRQRRKLARCAFDQPQPQKFATDRLPLNSLQFAADAVSGQLIVTSLPDRFRVCAAEHIDNVTQPESESVPCVDAIYAGKKFLRLHCAVECLTWLQAVVATVTRNL